MKQSPPNSVISKEEVKLKCHYCEKITSHENLDMI